MDILHHEAVISDAILLIQQHVLEASQIAVLQMHAQLCHRHDVGVSLEDLRFSGVKWIDFTAGQHGGECHVLQAALGAEVLPGLLVVAERFVELLVPVR